MTWLRQCSPRAQRWVGFIVCTFVLMLGGSYFLISILAEDMKREFRLTQQAVELILGLGVVCANLGYPWGIILHRVSEWKSFLLSMLMGSVSALLLYTADFAVEFYVDNWWLLALYWSLICSSFVIGYLVAMHVTLSNFPDNMKGTVVSVLNVGWWTGQGLFNYFYTLTRTGKLPTVGTIFLILAVCIFVIKGLASICVRPVELDDDCSALLKCERDDIPDSGALDDTNKSDPKDQDEGEGNAVVKVLGLGLFLQLDFHCVFWGFMLGNSSAVIYLGNVATIAVSLNLSEYIDTALITAPIAGLLVTVTCGCLSDRTRLVFPRAMYAVIGCLSNAIMFAISAVYGTKVAVFFTTVVVIFGTNGIFYCISSPIIGERFGMVHFKRNWGLISMCGSAFALVTTAVFGLLYESNIENEETTACIGLDCLQGVFIVGAVLSLAAAGCYLVLARRFIARCCRRRE